MLSTRSARLEADLLGRDFTVDALARHLDGGELVDPLGGIADLRGQTPAAPVRRRPWTTTRCVSRLFRLARAFDLLSEADAVDAARRAAPGLATVSGERIRDELSATLAAAGVSAAFRIWPSSARSPWCCPSSTGCAACARTRITAAWTCSVAIRWRRLPTWPV